MNETVKQFYDANPQAEWDRLSNHPFEFQLTAYMMDRHIRSGDTILDIGGGPGRYAIEYAKRGCGVTLVDLSEGNVEFARRMAREAGVTLGAQACDCLELDRLNLGQYDHVFLMGPLYHLVREEDRARAVENALKHLKPGGLLYASFILIASGLIFDLKNAGYIVQDMAMPSVRACVDDLLAGRPYAGPAFTTACFIPPQKIEGFMAGFPLEKLHLFGQEGILAPNELEIRKRDPEEIACWLEVAKRLLEVPELLSFSEHAMYIGRKIAQ